MPTPRTRQRRLAIASAVMALLGAGVLAWGLATTPEGPPALAAGVIGDLNASAAPPVAPLPAAQPTKLTIPSVGINADVASVGQNSDGTIQIPELSATNLAGWYTRSANPGTTGSSVLVGHVDNQTDPSVFFDLAKIHVGDLIDVRRIDGTDAHFRVRGAEHVNKDRLPIDRVFGDTHGRAELRLVTCGGAFRDGNYTENVIVYADLTG